MDTERKTIDRAIRYIHAAQRPEGLWLGSWGICFTYASMFALESLSLVGETYNTSARAKRACDYLVSKQMDDGGWGESYRVSISSHAPHPHFLGCWYAGLRDPEVGEP